MPREPSGFQEALKRHQVEPKISPRGSKLNPRDSQDSQVEPKTLPRGVQEPPTAPQERARARKERPKRAPRASKKRPREPQERPKRLQEGFQVRPKRHPSETSKKPKFLQLDSMGLTDTGGALKCRKIMKNRPPEAKKSIKIAKLRARKPR